MNRPAIDAFVARLHIHNHEERRLMGLIRAGQWPLPRHEWALHHQLEEALIYDMAMVLTDDELAAAIDEYDAAPGALL